MANLISIPEKTARSRSHDIELKNAVLQTKIRLDSNYSGIVRVSDTQTTVFITFALEGFPDQVDDNYTVLVTPIDFSGSCPDYAFVLGLAVGSTSSIQIRIDTAPGPGNWVDWHWKIFRWV